MKPLSLLILIWIATNIFLSCKTEPISYEDAIKNGPMDTMTIGDRKIPYKKIDVLLGAQLPLYSAPLMDSTKVDAEYFTDNVVVINFWFIGCQPCEAEMPGFNALVKKYETQPVRFLAITRNTPKDLQEFFATNPFNMDQLALGELITRDIYHMTWGYPTTLVADRTGKIIYAKSGGVDDSTAVQKIQDELIPVINGALKKM